jgi:uncharacterized membrane protein (UPF0136 family)
MTKLNAYFTLVYGLIVIAGGAVGFAKAGSMPSLIMGTTFGTLLLCSGWFMLGQSTLAYFASVALSGILALFFIYRFVTTWSFMPAGLMAILSLLILALLLFSKR